jgi:hypothetical protein
VLLISPQHIHDLRGDREGGRERERERERADEIRHQGLIKEKN